MQFCSNGTRKSTRTWQREWKRLPAGLRNMGKAESTMTNDQMRPYLENTGWEDKMDADAEAKRLKEYCDTHVRCINGHHRPKPAEGTETKCPVCGSIVPYFV